MPKRKIGKKGPETFTGACLCGEFVGLIFHSFLGEKVCL
jgi:hypothetical protein